MKKTCTLRHDVPYAAWYDEDQAVGLCVRLVKKHFKVGRYWKVLKVTISTEPFEGAVFVGMRDRSNKEDANLNRPFSWERVSYTFDKSVRIPTLPLFHNTACWLIKRVPGLKDNRKRIDLWVTIKPVESEGKL